jgi:hypothetical protein
MATGTKARTPGTKPQPKGSGGISIPPAEAAPGGRPPGKTRRPVTSPRHTRPSAAPKAQPQSRQAQARQAQARQAQAQARQPKEKQQRMPFILLLVGLLGGALVSLLVISTTLDEGSYDINNLTTQNNMLYKDVQSLTNQVNQEQDPAAIASEAASLGLRVQKDERFIDRATGSILIAPAVTPAP